MNRADRPRNGHRFIHLGVEALEERNLLDAALSPISGLTSSTAMYLDGLYHDLLQRSPSAAEINGWASTVASGTMTRSQIVPLFLDSGEYGAALIRADYQALLGRAPDPSGQAYWLNFLQTGGDHELLTAQLTGSDEYYTAHGGTASGWISGLFQDQLGRAPDPAGVAYWSGLLQNGTARRTVAMTVLTSAEADTRLIDGVYQQYLQRQPPQADASWWVSIMQQGWREAQVIALFAGSEEYFQDQQNRPEPLVYPTNLQYVGAFRLPAIADPLQPGDYTYSFGATALAFNPANHSLFLVGMPYDQAISEVAIPSTLVNSTNLDDLPVAPILQDPVQVLPKIPSNPLAAIGSVDIGGLSVANGQLLGTAYVYYDAGGVATVSHFVLNSLNLASAPVGGLYQVGNLGAGLVAGTMTPVPAEWQTTLGAPYLTGQGDISIISRTSSGPAAFGFDPSTLGPGAAPSTPFVYYPSDQPLGPYEGPADPLQSGTSQVNGMVFVPGTRSVLFFGSTGTNYEGYGLAPDYGDPTSSGKSPHSLNGEYAFQAWAYDASDFLAVKQGKMQPWQVKPYNVWNFDFPITVGAKQIGGTAFDPSTGRLYVSILNADNEASFSDLPLIEVFQLSMNSPGQGAPPQIGTLAATPDAPGIPDSTSPVVPGPVTAGTAVLLTAGNVYAEQSNASVTQVAFFLDTNGNGKLDSSDKLLGHGTTSGSHNWTLTLATDAWALGSYTIFAQAQDNSGVFGDPLALTLAVK